MNQFVSFCHPSAGAGVEQSRPQKPQQSEKTRSLAAGRKRNYNRAYHLAYYVKNRSAILEKTKLYAKEHPEIRAKIARNYKRNNPEKFRARLSANHSRRKAAMRGATHIDPKANGLIRKWRLRKSFICYYCKDSFPIKKMQVDHIVAVSTGGKHEVSNLCQSCPLCNIRKRNKPLSLVVSNGQTFLSL